MSESVEQLPCDRLHVAELSWMCESRGMENAAAADGVVALIKLWIPSRKEEAEAGG